MAQTTIAKYKLAQRVAITFQIDTNDSTKLTKTHITCCGASHHHHRHHHRVQNALNIPIRPRSQQQVLATNITTRLVRFANGAPLALSRMYIYMCVYKITVPGVTAEKHITHITLALWMACIHCICCCAKCSWPTFLTGWVASRSWCGTASAADEPHYGLAGWQSARRHCGTPHHPSVPSIERKVFSVTQRQRVRIHNAIDGANATIQYIYIYKSFTSI